MELQVKSCYKCKAEKPLTDFDNVKRKGEIIKHSYCKDCRRDYNRKSSKQYYDNNTESRKEYGKKYRAQPDYPERRRNWKNSEMERLTDGMVATILATELKSNVSEIRQIPGLIELKRATMLLKRKIKDNGTK